MSDDDIRNYINRKDAPPRPLRPKVRMARPRAAQPRQAAEESQFRDFAATHMLCPACRRAMPVRERLLLFLPDGDLYDYVCSACGTSTGTRKVGR